MEIAAVSAKLLADEKYQKGKACPLLSATAGDCSARDWLQPLLRIAKTRWHREHMSLLDDRSG